MGKTFLGVACRYGIIYFVYLKYPFNHLRALTSHWWRFFADVQIPQAILCAYFEFPLLTVTFAQI
jgi:hypothetical protein